MKTTTVPFNLLRLLTLAVAGIGLASNAAAQALGMTGTVMGMEEIAGTGASGHKCDVLVKFTGSPPSYSLPDSAVTYDWRFFVNSPGAIVDGTSGFSVSYGGSTSPEPSCGIAVTEGMVVRLRFPASTTLGASIKGMLCGRAYSWWRTYNASTMTYVEGSRYDFSEVDYNPFRLRSFPLEATSVTSRKTYAPPNKDGAYPAVDANAESRNVAFAGWSYRGGLFLGNAAGVNADQSGVARIQCQATDPGSLPTCVYTLSLLHIGTPAFYKSSSTGWNGAMSIQAYVPGGASGPNLPLADLNWSNSIDTGTAIARGAVVSLTAPSNEFLNVHLGEGAFPTRVLLRATDEAAALWRYFGGPSFSPATPVYPYSEGKPHLWACDKPTIVVARTSSSTGAMTSVWLITL